MVTVSDAEGGPHEKEMDIDVHTEVDDDELDVSTSLDSKRALTKSRAVKSSEGTDNNISVQVNSSSAGSTLQVNSELEEDEEPTLEAELSGRGGRERARRTIKMETDSENSSQEEGEQQITLKKRPKH